MQVKRTAFLCGALVVLMTGAGWADDEPKGYVCTFDAGTAWTFNAGKFAQKSPEPIKLAIADVNLERQTATLVPDAGKAPGALKIVRAINANHFLEVVNEGFLNLTTVYDKDPASGQYPAVHSRHFGVLGQPVVAQYAGTCTAK
jgi:hypothetical protein